MIKIKSTNSLFSDLVFPDKKPKDVIQDDEDPKGKDTNPDDVKTWVDGHPEIGKMQKEVFDDIFDTTDEDEDDARKGPFILLCRIISVECPTNFEFGTTFSSVVYALNLF